MKLFTVGVYGRSEKEFFDILVARNIGIFIDVRQRRGMRGRQYSFVNSLYLQGKLSLLGIEYVYLKELAPTSEARKKQKEADLLAGDSKRLRSSLSPAFCNIYNELILDKFDFSILREIMVNGSACLFCVECNCDACHRGLIAARAGTIFNDLEVVHL